MNEWQQWRNAIFKGLFFGLAYLVYTQNQDLAELRTKVEACQVQKAEN